MVQHMRDVHPDVDLSEPPHKRAETLFTMKAHRKYKTALDRQLGEALMISRAGGTGSASLMNRKDEYTRCMVPEVEMNEGWRGVAKLKRSRESHKLERNPKRPRREIGTHPETPSTPQDPPAETRPTGDVTPEDGNTLETHAGTQKAPKNTIHETHTENKSKAHEEKENTHTNTEIQGKKKEKAIEPKEIEDKKKKEKIDEPKEEKSKEKCTKRIKEKIDKIEGEVEKETASKVNQKHKENEATQTHTQRDTQTVTLKPPPSSKQNKLQQKPRFKNPRKKANPQPSSERLTNKISKYFKPITYESERGTGKRDLGQEQSLIHLITPKLITQDQDLRETERPGGQAELNPDRGGQTLSSNLDNCTSSRLTFNST